MGEDLPMRNPAIQTGTWPNLFEWSECQWSSNPIIGTNLLRISLHSSREREREREWVSESGKNSTPMKLSRNEILGERDARCGVREHLRSFAFLPRAEKQWRTIPNNLGPRRKFCNRSTRWIRKIDPLFLFDRQNGSQMYRKKERENFSMKNSVEDYAPA